MTDPATHAGAVAAITSPWWLPWVLGVSAGAAWLLPILGCLWLSVQIGFFLYNKLRKKTNVRTD